MIPSIFQSQVLQVPAVTLYGLCARDPTLRAPLLLINPSNLCSILKCSFLLLYGDAETCGFYLGLGELFG